MPDGKNNDKNIPRHWHRLDNTANLFPVVATKRFTNVYRISINLTENVIPELLQQALETVLPWFAAFKVRLRHGVFWHYLEANPSTPTVHEEDDYPLRYINPEQNKQFLFRLNYYASRINLEIFHVLTDGTGSLQFLQAIVCQYLLLAYPNKFTEEDAARHWFAEHAINTEDSYAKNYAPVKRASFRLGKGHKLRGERNILDNLGVIHAQIHLPGLLAFCRSKGVSITQYITACIAWAIYTQQLNCKPARYPVNILMPVNLRSMFNSNTALNFFSPIYISLMYKQENCTFDDILAEVKQQFYDKITREDMLEKISYTVGSGNNTFVRFAPLPIKNAVLRLVYETSAKTSTLGYTNLGQVKMPPQFEAYCTGAIFMNSTAPREPLKCASISYGDIFTLSFSSSLTSPALQCAVVRKLTEDGLDVTVESNGVNYENM